MQREKSLLHEKIEKEILEDKRIPKRKCEDYIKELLKPGDKSLKKETLARQLKQRIEEKYPGKSFSVDTIRPKLSYIKFP